MKPIRLSFLRKENTQENKQENIESKELSVSISKINYNSPINKDLAVCLVFFNYSHSSRLIMNVLYTIEKLKIANIPIFIIEAYLSSPQIKDALHVKTESPLFLKENLYRILEKQIPLEYTKLMFMDSDLIFENKNWYNDISTYLNSYDVVKPFTTASFLDLTYSKIILRKFNHEGFAWAMTRSWYNKVGFFDLAILGSGDSIFFKSLSNQIFVPPYGDCIKPSLEDYVKKIQTHKPSYKVYDSVIYHLYHGSLGNRQYGSRYSIFNDVKDIRSIILTSPDGHFELSDKSYIPKINMFFKHRKDDSL